MGIKSHSHLEAYDDLRRNFHVYRDDPDETDHSINLIDDFSRSYSS